MLFDSFDYLVFFPIIFVLYWLVTQRNLLLQNWLILVASLFFYGSWDYRFLFLLLFSIGLDYTSGIMIQSAASQSRKKLWLWLSIGINLGFLGIFKYYDFFASSFADLLNKFGIEADFVTLNLVLPVGISFYTFHGLSYIIDIYKGRIPAERNFVVYAVFVSFFPLLVAGPIERATHLLPQIQKPRLFQYSMVTDGLRRILWGLFKKIVVADGCAEFANLIFNNSDQYSGSTLVLGALFFTFQIYCDFSGYSDIALGSARMLGINLLQNFNYPYFSRDIAEFWRRWHISLSSWFRDYLYIPLGGSRGGTWMKVRNTFIIFLVSGFWHGANWTFIAWGALNALYFMPLLLAKKNRDNLGIVAEGRFLPSWREFGGILITFSLTVLAWVFFRAENIGHAIDYLAGIFTADLFALPDMTNKMKLALGLACILLVIEWVGRTEPYAIARLDKWMSRPIRWTFYYALIMAIFFFSGRGEQFIYFQF